MGCGKRSWAEEQDELEAAKKERLCHQLKEKADPIVLNNCIDILIRNLRDQQLSRETWIYIENLQKAWFGDIQ